METDAKEQKQPEAAWSTINTFRDDTIPATTLQPGNQHQHLVKRPSSIYSTLRVPPDFTANQQQLLTPIPLSYAPPSVIRFSSHHFDDQSDSLETFNFDATPLTAGAGSTTTKGLYETWRRQRTITDESRSSVQPSSSFQEQQPIPHSSGMTVLTNVTTDDSTTLIGQGRKQQLHHQQRQLQQEQLSMEEHQQEQEQGSRRLSFMTKPVSDQATASSGHDTGNSRLPMETATAGLRRKPTVRNYQVFPGRNKFFCGGRLMTSREYWAFILALVFVIAPSVLFGIFTCPFIWENIHPVIPILFAYLFVLCLTSMIKTSWTDPGIIPRDLDPYPILETYGDDQSSLWQHQSFPMPKQVQIKDSTWTLKYCETCRIYRPPRASHCRQCDNCVEIEDHHCIWLNNCIGKRNYRPFFVFITTATLLCLFVIVFSIVHLLLIMAKLDHDRFNHDSSSPEPPEVSFHTVFREAPVSFVLAIVCFFLLLMVGGLTLYHCSLILRGITTHEQLRQSFLKNSNKLGANPYNKGNPLLNMAHVLCRPRPKSYLRRRKFVDPAAMEKLPGDQQRFT